MKFKNKLSGTVELISCLKGMQTINYWYAFVLKKNLKMTLHYLRILQNNLRVTKQPGHMNSCSKHQTHRTFCLQS